MTSLVQAIEARFTFHPPPVSRALDGVRSYLEWIGLMMAILTALLIG